MRPYIASKPFATGKEKPSDELRIGITFRRPQDRLGPTKIPTRLSAASVMSFTPEAYDVDLALQELHRRGFVSTVRGRLTASVRGTREQFEKVFGTTLETFRVDPKQDYQFHSFYYPPDNAAWHPDPALMQLIDDAYIQWPHIYMARKRAARRFAAARPAARRAPARAAAAAPVPSAVPPSVPYWHLDVPDDVSRFLNATPVHQAGTLGRGVTVAMVDTGFYHAHPFFPAHSYTSSVVLAPGASNRETDPGSHGTGESANVFSIAPGATFVGVKLEDDANPNGGASMLEGFQEALRHQPQVISISMGYDLRAAGNQPLAQLPGSLKALEAEIHAAVATGIVVVFSAGNGHYSFPGQMPDVISAGGVFVAADGSMQASDYASAFTSLIYSGRSVPDFSGLVGLLPHADYIMLPVPAGEEIDRDNSSHDGTRPDDGWGVFSGTSAAAPQLAAVCALLLEKNRGLKPADIKALLRRTAREVSQGHANPASDPNGAGEKATDGAAGTGLVDAYAAWQQA
jgi:subtilisin family serine protease